MPGWGFWPAYRDRSPRVRTMALWNVRRGGGVLLETGELHYPGSWEELKTLVLDQDLDLYLDDLGSMPWMEEAIQDPKAEVICRERDHSVAGIEVRGKRKRRWIGEQGVWGFINGDISHLLLLRQLMEHMGEGTRQSPSSLGQAIMRRCWREQGLRPRRVPSRHIRGLLEKLGVGGRSDHKVRPEEVFEQVYEVDLKNAYLSRMHVLPDGMPDQLDPEVDGLLEQTAKGTMFGPYASDIFTWVGRAVVHIPEGIELNFGPFPVRLENGDVEYPVSPGWYGAEGEGDLLLWKEEVQDCLEAGCEVWLRGPQWGWRNSTSGMALAAERMARLRDEAPEGLDGLVKLCIVASIGWFGQKPLHSVVVPAPAAADDEGGDAEPLLASAEAGAFAVPYHVRKERKESLPFHPEWMFYNAMMVRRDALQLAREAELQGLIVKQVNFDAVYGVFGRGGVAMVGRGKGHQIKGRPHRLLEFGRPHKITVLTGASFPYPRAVVSREKVRLPGTVRSP